MQHRKRIRYTIAFAFLGIGVLLFLVLNVCIGTVKISVADIIVSLMGQKVDNSKILWDIRMPRTLAAMILGGALALAGYLLQTFFHNPIAGPFVLGISNGAKMVVTLVMVFLIGQGIRVSSAALIVAAFAGAIISMGFVLLMSNKVNNMSRLIVSGVMIGYICTAVTEFVITFASNAQIVNLHNWSRGSFSGMTWDNVNVMALVIAITFGVVFLLAKPLSAYQLGEAYAQNMGVNTRRLRVMLVVLSSILSACIVAYAGPVLLSGLCTAPGKEPLGTTKPVLMIPACFLGGSVFCLFCDLLARTMFAPTELEHQYSYGGIWSTCSIMDHDKA